MYNNLRTFINSKGKIGMPTTDRHVWNHAYKHDKVKKGYSIYLGQCFLNIQLLIFLWWIFIGSSTTKSLWSR